MIRNCNNGAFGCGQNCFLNLIFFNVYVYEQRPEDIQGMLRGRIGMYINAYISIRKVIQKISSTALLCDK